MPDLGERIVVTFVRLDEAAKVAEVLESKSHLAKRGGAQLFVEESGTDLL